MLPAFPVESDGVVDPTGAGDSFAGGMMGHLATHGRVDIDSLQEAIAWGTVTASCTLESFGLDGLRNVDLAGLESRMNQFQQAAWVGPRQVTA